MFESATAEPSDGHALIHLPSVTARERDDFASALREVADALPRIGGAVTCRVASEMPRNWKPERDMFIMAEAFVETLIDSEPDRIDPTLAVQIVGLAEIPLVPETIALQVAFGRKIAERESRRMLRPGYLGLFHGGDPRKPSPHRLTHGIAMFRRIAGLVTPLGRPAMLCILAWLTWARGQPAFASAYAAEAARLEPGYPLATEIMRLASSGQPDWVQTEVS